jgi:hypothetical protein
MSQQPVASFAGPDLDKSRSLQLADDFSPGHITILKPNVGLCQKAGASARARRAEESLVNQIFASWNRLDRWLQQVEGLRRAA